VPQHHPPRDREPGPAAGPADDGPRGRLSLSELARDGRSRDLVAFLETTSDWVWEVDADGRYTYASPRVVEFLGYRPEELLGRAAFELMPADEARRVAAVFAAHAAAREAFFAFEKVCLHRDGRRVILETSGVPMFGPNGELEGYRGCDRDITERKRAEAALRESQQRYRSLFENLLVGVAHCRMLFVDGVPAEWVYLDVNATFEKLTGLTHVVGRRVSDLIPGIRKANPEAFEIFGRVSLTGIPERFETYLEPLKMWLSVAVSSVQREYFVAVFDNITERKRTEEALRQAQKLDALGTLAGGIAHDFNNILLAITGNTQLARADLSADHPAQAPLAEIAKAGTRAADLVRRILAFSRPQNEPRTRVDLHAVVAEAVGLLRPALPAMIGIRTECAPGVPAVSAAPTQVHQVIVNLATNAADAIGSRPGLIELRIDALEVTDAVTGTVPGLPAGRYARVRVSDTGRGIAPAHRERIFDPFFSTKPPGAGTGLGLSIVHGIMKGHGGAVGVDSEPGRGSTFTLYFPVVDEVIASVAVPSGAAPPGRGQRVLYLDDDEALVVLLTRVLGRLGYAVFGFADPEQALRAFQARPDAFDVVVTDLGMPKLSGLDFARAVRRTRADVPIIVTTGYVRPEDEAAAGQLGLAALILKPDTADQLGHELARLFCASASPAPGARA